MRLPGSAARSTHSTGLGAVVDLGAGSAFQGHQCVALEREHERRHRTCGKQLRLAGNDRSQRERHHFPTRRPIRQCRVRTCPLQQGGGDYRLRQRDRGEVSPRFFGDERSVEQA